ncbi:ATP-binding protein [Planotetraspora sp. GP83]|uniref:ATP-binding protein n=1 Tax=Planotetraspora sp. GP83 TaxID=3156264 RepID=UPI003517E813
MKDSEIDYEAVFKATHAPLTVLTRDLIIAAVNDSYLEVTGRTEADLLGRDIFAAFPRNPDAHHDPDGQGAEALRASLQRVAATGEQDIVSLLRYDVEANGGPGGFEKRYWTVVNAPVLGEDGEVRLILHRVEEVTGFLQRLRRPRERDVTGARAELQVVEADVYVRARELLDLNERLKRTHRQQRKTTAALREAIERQRRLVFDVSHDLRNPITGLLTELETALSEPDIDLEQILRKLLRNAERLNDIVADLLELARLDNGARAAAEPVDVTHLVLDELERRTSAAAVHTRLDERVMVRASRIRLARLLGNLLSNAERHTTTKIEIVLTADPPDAILEVIDDGPGIAPADRERVFERLCRLDAARRLDPGGSGLGLPIAREIAHAYGGDLYAADHPIGARFVLRLPLA